MHIPDGFLDLPTTLGAGAAAAAGVALAMRRGERHLGDRAVPLAGLLSAFVFAAQMFNFPVAAGTSGHLLGGALAAVLLGPWLASVGLTVVVVSQALLFADGGVLALGANLVNMALLAPWTAWGVWRLARYALPARTGVAPAAFLAGLASVLAAAGGFVAEYALGGVGTAPIGLVAGAMLGTHLLIGLGEAAITAALVVAVVRLRPDLVAGERTGAAARPPLTPVVVTAALTSLVVVALAAVFASGWPDGLERVAEAAGMRAAAAAPAPLAGYALPGVAAPTLAAALAGVIGVVLLLALTAVARALGWRRRGAPAEGRGG